MSMEQFWDACRKMEGMPYFNSGGCQEEEIERAQALLGVSFSPQCLAFYRKYDYTSFAGIELFGVQGEPDAKILEGSSLAYALYDRKKYNLPAQWIPFYNIGDGSMAYFDYTTLNSAGEPKIIRAYHDGKKYHVIEELAEDFGEFLSLLIQYAS